MPKNVSVDGLGDFEFPDEATDGQIKVYLRKQAGLTPHGDKTQRAPKPEPPPPAIAIHKETGVGLVDPGRFDPTKGWGHPDRNGARIAPTYAATADVVAKAPDSTEYVKPSDIPPGYRQSQSQLFTNTRNQLAKSRAEAGGATLASTRTPDQIQAVPDDLPAPLSVMEKRIASAGPAVTGTLDVINERNPMKYWGASAEKFAAPFRVSQDSGAEPPGLSDVLNVLGVGAVSNALTAGGAGRDIDKTGAAQILDPGLAEMTGGVNSIMSGPREFLAPGEGESKAKAAAMLVPRLAGAGVDTFIDPTNMVMMGAGKFGKTAPVRALADTYFAGLMGEGAAQAAGHVAERGAEDGATGVMQALPELAVPAVFGGHAALRGAKAVSGVVEGARQSSAAKKTSAALESATASATEKAAANIANGAGLFDNMTAQEIHAYGLKRRAEATGQPLARDNATDELASIAKTVYGDRPDLNVNIHENASSVKPGLLPEDAAVAAQIPALFDGDKTVGLVRDRINDPLQAVENAKHEKTHGTVEMEPGKIAGVAEDAMKAELVKLVEEKRLAPEEAERLAGLTGPEFVSAVKESAKSNPAMRNASDEVIALLGEQFAAEPGRISQLMGEAARVIPGVTMTPSDVRASMAAQARKKAQPFQPDRPVEMLGEAPQLPPVDRRPAQPVEAAPVVEPAPAPVVEPVAPVVAEAPVAPKESFVGREVTVGGKKAKIIADDGSGKFVIQPEKGEPRIWTPNKTSHPSVPQKGERVALPDGTEGVIYSTDKTSAAVRFDDGTSKIVKREGLRRVEQPVAPEVPVAQPVQQVAPVQLAEAPEHRANIATRKAIDEMTPDEARYAVEALRQERHTDEQTGLKNYKAWLEDPIDAETPVKVITDADNFKAYNTNFGHAGGDVVIKDALAEGFRRAGLGDNAYRISRSGGGDEFAFKFKTREEAVAKMEHAREVVRGMRITLEKDGVTRVHEGVEFSHGIGERLDLKDADADLVRNKEQRAADGVRATGRDALPPGFREVRDDLGSTGGRVEGEVGGVPGPDATGPVDPAAASQSPALYSRAPSKHDQLVRPIMGDLVEVASQLMADKANKIRTPEDLVRAMTDRMNGRLAKEVEIESKAIFDEAVKPPADRANLPSVQKALDEKLLPAKELGVSEDQRTREVQLAVDRAREDAGVVTKRADETTQAAGIKLLSNVGTEGVELMVLDRAKSPGGTLNDTETVAAKLALQDADRNKAMMSDPVLFAQRKAFANAFRITGTEQGRALRQRRWDITSPTHERVKAALYEILMNSGDKKPLPNAASKAAVELKKIRDFLTKEAGVKDVESIPIEMLTDEAAMTSLVREWSSKQASVSMKMRTWYLNSLVSAFKTHTANMVGNGVNFAFEYGVHRRLEARINQLFGVDGILPSDLKGMSAQFLKAQSAAMRDTAHYLKTGKNNLEQRVHGAEWYDQLRQQKRSFSGKAGTIIEASTRFLGTEDAYAVSLIGHMEAYATARMLARKEMSGKVGTPEYNARVDELVNDYGSKAWSRAMDRAEYLTFKDESGKLIKSLLAFRRAHPNVSYILPFITTPANLLARGTEFVPGVGLMFRGILADRAAVKSGELAPPGEMTLTERYSRLAAAQLIGLGATIAVAASGASMFKDDNDEPFITGSEPPRKFDRGEQEARRRSLPAYTFRNPLDPTERISYRRIDPISTAVGLTVDMVDMWRDAEKNKDFGRILDKGKNAVIGQLVGKTFLKGPSDWIEWVQDEPGAKFPLFDVATGFYPNALRQIPAALDPYVREQKQYGADSKQTGQGQAERFAKTMAFKATGMPYIPGIGTLVEPKVNVYGDEVRKTGSPLYRGFIPFDRSGEEQISPEGRQADLRYIRTINDLPADTPSLPMESGPRVSFAGQNIQMTPRDWHDYETEKGSFLKSNIGDVTDPANRQKKLEPWQIEMMRSLASAGGSVAASKVAPKYLK